MNFSLKKKLWTIFGYKYAGYQQPKHISPTKKNFTFSITAASSGFKSVIINELKSIVLLIDNRELQPKKKIHASSIRIPLVYPVQSKIHEIVLYNTDHIKDTKYQKYEY